MNPARGWWAEFLLLAAIWGASFLFMRIAALEMGALAAAALRVAIASVFLLPLMLQQGHWPLLRQHWKPVLLVGAFNSGLPFALYAFAVLHITTGLSSILNATVPLFGALVAWAWLGERPNLARALGLALGFSGVALLASGQASFKPDDSGIAPGWAVLACLLATLCYALAASFTRKHIPNLPALVIATGSQIGATAALAVPALWMSPGVWPSAGAWGALLALGVLCSGVAYILYFRLLEHTGPSRTLTVTFLVPVFALAYGALLLDEHITPRMLVCGAVVLLGTGLSSGLIRLPRR